MTFYVLCSLRLFDIPERVFHAGPFNILNQSLCSMTDTLDNTLTYLKVDIRERSVLKGVEVEEHFSNSQGKDSDDHRPKQPPVSEGTRLRERWGESAHRISDTMIHLRLD